MRIQAQSARILIQLCKFSCEMTAPVKALSKKHSLVHSTFYSCASPKQLKALQEAEAVGISAARA